MIILDTDALTFLEHTSNLISGLLRDRLTLLSAEHEVVTTVISYEEQTRGWFAVLAKARQPEAEIAAYDRLVTHLDTFRRIDVLRYTPADAAQFARLRSSKIRIGTADLKIAAIALSRNAILFTRNLRGFSQIPSLHVQDWARP